MGIRPGDAVLVMEHRGEQQLVYNALVVGFSMDESLAGTHGEPALRLCFVVPHLQPRYVYDGVRAVPNVVHISHRDFVEGRARLGYEEQPQSGAVSGWRSS